MANTSIGLPPDVNDYLVQHGVRESALLTRLRDETKAIPQHNMQIAPEQGAFLALLVELIGARRCLEIGTFTGYSSLAVALAMPPHGTIVCCDVSDEWTSIARRSWAAAGVADRIELRLGPGADTLRSLPQEETIDLAFIDADKPNYANYYDELLPRVRRNGLILVDNVLWSGRVVDDDASDENTVAIKAFNDKVASDDRVEAVMLPISDGLTLLRKR